VSGEAALLAIEFDTCLHPFPVRTVNTTESSGRHRIKAVGTIQGSKREGFNVIRVNIRGAGGWRLDPRVRKTFTLGTELKTLTRPFLAFPLMLASVWTAELRSPAQAPDAKTAARTPSLESYRKYALTHEGDVSRGAALFADEQKLACSKCHSVDGRAGKAGPDLFAVGDKFGRRDLVDAVLAPSATISPGYGTVIVETKAGDEIQGTLKQATDDGVQLMGADAKLISIAKSEIKEQRGSAVSLMPEGLQAGMSLKEFTDLTEYLVTLKQPESALASNHGMPAVIPQLARPVVARPFFLQELKLPRSRVQTGLTSFHQLPGFTTEGWLTHDSRALRCFAFARFRAAPTASTRQPLAELPLPSVLDSVCLVSKRTFTFYFLPMPGATCPISASLRSGGMGGACGECSMMSV
jgi:putative heme-binding domain-containing protein